MIKKMPFLCFKRVIFQLALGPFVAGLFFIHLFIQPATADNSLVANEVNYLGTSGLFFVPTGTTIDYGEFHYSYSNMVDVKGYRQQQVKPGKSPFDGNVFSFSVSPFPGIEVGMSNMGYDLSRGSDLIANFKYSPTFIPKQWFDLSIGAIDLGGETGGQRAVYSSLSKQLGPARITVGAGSQKQQKTLKRYEGGFAGIEYQPYSWLTAVAEYDGINSHYGIKLRTPKQWMGGHTQIYGSGLVSTDIKNSSDTNYFGLGIRTSLFSSVDQKLEAPKPLGSSIKNHLSWLFDGSTKSHKTIVKKLPTQFGVDNNPLVERLGKLKRQLTKQGFESVWVGKDKGRLIIRFENPVFNRNDIDALGVVMGLAAHYEAENFEVLDISLQKNSISTLRFQVDINKLRSFYTNHTELPLLNVMPATHLKAGNTLWVGGSGSPFLTPRIGFSPKLNYFVGTELGVYDYSVALRSTIELPLWHGAELYADYDYNLGQSRDFERGRSFYRWSVPSRWSNFAFKQTLRLPFSLYSSLGVGRFKGVYQEDYSGLFGEVMWQSPQGNHMLTFNGGYYESNVFEGAKREVGIGQYRYYWDALDVAISIEGGQYWKLDRGGKLEVAFNFGDTKARFYVQDTDSQLVGIGFTIPLGMRKDMTPSFIQLKGTDNFGFGFGTSVNTGLGSNPLKPGRARYAPYSNHLKNYYFNNDRLNVAYIRANKHRLRDAFSRWVFD